MATRTIVVDDLNDQPGAETVSFAVGDQGFEIDLTGENKALLEKALAPYIQAGRMRGFSGPEHSKIRPTRTQPKVKASREQMAAIRAWARGTEWPDLSNYGRIPQFIIDAFDAAH